MAVNDLSNKETIIKNYLKELSRKEFPNVDLSDHGAFMETFGTPHLKLLLPLLEYADRIKLTQSLDNAEMMTEEEMDQLAAGYFAYRDAGEYSVGTAILDFDDLPANGVLQIPAGAEAESKSGLRFRTTETVILSESELPNYFDGDLFVYRVPVFFEAENPGQAYDIEENELTTMITPLDYLSSITNEVSFKGGRDRESNVELANRIIETGGAPNVGVERGWINFAKGFNDVEDVIVAGFGHELMQRDIIGITPEGRFSKNSPPEVHWGGKVDLYLRGKTLAEATDSGILERNADGELIVPLTSHPTYDILEIEFTPARNMDPDLDPSYFYVKDFLLMKDEGRETVGTLLEKSWVVIKDERLMEGDTVYVRYRYNRLIQDIDDDLHLEENRPPASDVRVKESIRKFLHGALVLRLENPQLGINENDKSAIRQNLYNWVRDLPTGAEIQFSDLALPIYDTAASSTGSRVDYISFPSQYLITDHDNKFIYYCLSQDKRELLEKLEAGSLYFSEWIPYYRDNVTLYDFLDVMHLLTYQNFEKDAWKTLAMRDHVWGKRVNFVEMSRRMIAYVNTLQRLSPAKWKPEQNHYFELGSLTIYEDIPYSDTELERLVSLFENIANPEREEPVAENMLHLIVYCSIILYVLTAPHVGGMSERDISNWLVDLTKGTPIDYMVHN